MLSEDATGVLERSPAKAIQDGTSNVFLQLEGVRSETLLYNRNERELDKIKKDCNNLASSYKFKYHQWIGSHLRLFKHSHFCVMCPDPLPEASLASLLVQPSTPFPGTRHDFTFLHEISPILIFRPAIFAQIPRHMAYQSKIPDPLHPSHLWSILHHIIICAKRCALTYSTSKKL